MRTWLVVAILIVIVVLAALAAQAFSGGTPVEAAVAREGSIREFVDERGKTRLPQTYTITMPNNARLEAIELLEGTPVKKGQVVARVVPQDMNLKVDLSKAAIDRLTASIRENDDASVEKTGWSQSVKFVESMNRSVDAARERVKVGEAKLSYATKNLERVRKLFQSPTRAKSEDEYDQAQVQQVQASVDYQQDLLVLRAMEALQAGTALMPTSVLQYIARKNLTHDVLEKQQVEAKINLKQVELEKARADMKSPIDGVVLDRLSSDEKEVSAGTALLKIGRIEDLEVEVDILSQDVVHVKVGDAAEVSGPAIGPIPARGKVTRIYPAGFTKVSSLGVEQQRVKVIVKFAPEELTRLRKDRGLGPDYRVSVRIFTAEKEHALVIPRSALFRGADGGWQIFVIQGRRAVLTPVETGLINDESVEIRKGLKAGELVVLAPETSLVSGTRVSPIVREARPAPDQPSVD